MNIFQEAYLALRFKAWLSAEIKEGKKMNGATPGWKTSEFWMTLATTLGSLYGSVSGMVPAPWNVIVPVAGVALYTVARTIVKAIADISAAKTQVAAVTNTTPPTTAS